MMWNKLSSEFLTSRSYFNDVMQAFARDRPQAFSALNRSSTLLVASDFTGAERSSRFNTLSIVIAPIEGVAEWNLYRQALRQKYNLAGRRISYSKLNDRRKREAIREFLYLGNAIVGLSVTTLIDKRIQSIFTPSGYLDPREVVPGRPFEHWKPVVFERVMRAAHFAALLVAGVSSPLQDVIWITDEDEIAASTHGLTDLTEIFGRILGNMLSRPLGHIRVGTTGTTAGDDLAMEDLAALADLIAATVNALVCSYGDDVPLVSFVALAPEHLSRKAKRLMPVLFAEQALLQKVIFIVEPVPGSQQLRYGSVRPVAQRGWVGT
jgi:hypothetical protein